MTHETTHELLNDGWTQETESSIVLDPAAPWDTLTYRLERYRDTHSLWAFYKVTEEWEQIAAWTGTPTADEVWTAVDDHEPKKQPQHPVAVEAETFFRLLKEGGMTLAQVERVLKLTDSFEQGRLMFKKDRKALWKRV